MKFNFMWNIHLFKLGQWARIDELQEMLSFVDTDGDGTVSFEEFVEILANITDTGSQKIKK